MHFHATRDVEHQPTINRPHSEPRLLFAGHFHTRAGYATVRQRGTRDWLLFYTVTGSGRIVHLDGPLLTQPGDCVILPPGLAHDYRIADGCREWEFLWAHFCPWPHWLGLMAWPQRYRGVKFAHIDDGVIRKRTSLSLKRMVSAMQGARDQAELFAMNALEEALLWLNSSLPRAGKTGIDPRISSAIDYICANIHRTLSLADIGRHCGLSSSRLSHLFSAQIGVTPIAYVEEQRIRKARELLDISAFSVSEIAYQIGFESPYYFSRRFRKSLGVSPRQYRQGQESVRTRPKGASPGTSPAPGPDGD